MNLIERNGLRARTMGTTVAYNRHSVMFCNTLVRWRLQFFFFWGGANLMYKFVSGAKMSLFSYIG